MKTTNLLWSCSLVVLGICTIVLVGVSILRIERSDFITRGVGLIDLAALSIFAYATVKKLKDKK